MLEESTLTSGIKKLNTKIKEQGYNLDDLIPILKDKDAVFILFLLLIRALVLLCSKNKERSYEGRAGMSFCKKETAIVIPREEVFPEDNFLFLPERFAASL